MNNRKTQWKFIIKPGFAVMLLLSTVLCKAQTVKRQNISCLGSTIHSGEVTVEQTAGQPYNTKSCTGSTVSVLQGFQQPPVLSIEKITPPEYKKNLKIDVYPNPASYAVTLRSEEIIKNSVIRVTDMDGRLIIAKHIPQMQTYSMDCNELADGIYIITVCDENRNMTSYKLIISK